MSERLPHQHAIFLVAVAVVGLSALMDVRRGEIPNWLTYGALVLAPLLHIGRMLGAHETLERSLTEGALSVAGALLCIIVPAILYKQGAIGGGDLKLLAGVGAFLQPVMGIEAEMYGFFGAMLVAPAVLAYRGKLIATLANSFRILANLFMPKAKQRQIDESALSWFRLGPALLFGVVLTAYLHW